MENKSNGILLSGVIGAILAVLLFAFLVGFGQSAPAYASTTSGLPARVATSSTIFVGPNLVTATTSRTTLFTADGTCVTRVISTVGQPILLSFDNVSSTTPNGATGFIQAASTTVAYDSGQYGCGLVSAYGYSASTTITIMETQ